MKTIIEQLITELEEVDKQMKEVGTQLKECDEISSKHRRTLRMLQCQRKKLSQEIKKLEDLEMFGSLEVEGFLKDEIDAIYKDIDKTDYRKSDRNLPRLHDLGRILEEVREIKKCYPGWILHSMCNSGQLDLYPPHIFYQYTFKTDKGHLINFGGLPT